MNRRLSNEDRIAQATFDSLVDMLLENAEKISQDEARRRVKALMTKTDILLGDPQSSYYKTRLDLFLQIPSRDHKLPLPFLLQTQLYQAALIETINEYDIVTRWEKETGKSIGIPDATDITTYWNSNIDYTTGKFTGVFADFERFFCDIIWVRYQIRRIRKN